MVTATWIACVVAVDGMFSLLFDLPVVRERGVGALYEPGVILFAGAVLFLRLFAGVRPGLAAAALLTLDAVLLCYFAQVLASAFGVFVDRRSPGEGLVALIREVPAPGTIATAGIAGLCAALFAWLVAREEAHPTR